MTANEYIKSIKDNLDSVEHNLEQIQCDDCISREAAIYVASGFCHPSNVAKELAKLPPVTPQPKTAELRNVIEEVLRNINGSDNYSIGQRNTLRWMLWCIDEGEEPEYEKIPKQKTGHWIAEENEEMETIGYYCSECDLPMETEEKTRFCPNCGAKMEVSK